MHLDAVGHFDTQHTFGSLYKPVLFWIYHQLACERELTCQASPFYKGQEHVAGIDLRIVTVTP